MLPADEHLTRARSRLEKALGALIQAFRFHGIHMDTSDDARALLQRVAALGDCAPQDIRRAARDLVAHQLKVDRAARALAAP